MKKHAWIGRKVELYGRTVIIIDIRDSHFGDQFRIRCDDGKEKWVTADHWKNVPKYAPIAGDRTQINAMAEMATINRRAKRLRERR